MPKILRLNQSGLIHLIPLLILLAGIIAGVYLVKHPQIFKPRAHETRFPLTQYDEPPALLVSTESRAQSLLGEAGQASDYSITFNQTEDEITLDADPQELSEETAKQSLNQADVYYLRTIMWLLLDPFNKIDGPPVDPWYALCDHLSEDVLAKVGPEPTFLKGEEEGQVKQLSCSDPPPSRNQFELTDPHANFIYKKIPATVLIKMVETARLERENKSLQQNAADFALSMVPILGPTLTASAGENPQDVAQATIINTILNLFGGEATKGVIKGGKVLVNLAGSKLGVNRFVVSVGEGGEKLVLNAETKNGIAQKLFEKQRIVLKIKPGLPKFLGYWFDDIIPLFDEGLAHILDPQQSRTVFKELLDRLKNYQGGILTQKIPSLVSSEYQGTFLQTAKNNWVIVVDSEEFLRRFGEMAAFARGPVVVVSEKDFQQAGLLEHEFTHVISHNLRPEFKYATHYIYNQEQANAYGALMSQIYEVSTDMVVKELYGIPSAYQQKYPDLYRGIERLIDTLIEQGHGTISKADFMEFALTGSDERLRERIFQQLTPDRFMELINKEIDAAKLVRLVEEARARRINLALKYGTGVILTGEGAIFFSNVWANEVSGQDIPDNAVIIPDEPSFNQDVDLTPPSSN